MIYSFKKDIKKISKYNFFYSISANFIYLSAIFIKSTMKQDILDNLPWIICPFLIMVLDIFIYFFM